MMTLDESVKQVASCAVAAVFRSMEVAIASGLTPDDAQAVAMAAGLEICAWLEARAPLPPKAPITQASLVIRPELPPDSLSSDEIDADLKARIKIIFERDIVPATRESFHAAIRR